MKTGDTMISAAEWRARRGEPPIGTTASGDLDERTPHAMDLDEAPPADNKSRRGQERVPSAGEQPLAIESELDWSLRFVAEHGEDLRHVWDWSRWYVWDGRRWSDNVQDAVRRRAKKSARKHTVEMLDAGGDVLQRARVAESARGIESTLRLAASEAGVAVQHELFDADPMLLNVANGTIDLRSGKLRAHRRSDLITKLAPVDFVADASAPTWDKFVRDVLPADDVRAFVQRYLGYSLTGDVGEQVLAFFHGGGANGKSTLIGAVQRIIGDYACQAPDSLLIARRHEVHPTELTALHGRRLAICSEIENGKRLNEVQVKQLTGGDRVTARRMREDFWEFAPTHKLLIAANHKPRVRGTDEGIWRRLLLVPFDVTVSPERRDPHLPEKLAAEHPGILAWLIRGCLDWQSRGLDPPEEVTAASANYRFENDRVAEFINERCEVRGNACVSVADLYTGYRDWCDSGGDERPVTKRALGEELKRRGFGSEQLGRGRAWTWLGIGLRDAA